MSQSDCGSITTYRQHGQLEFMGAMMRLRCFTLTWIFAGFAAQLSGAEEQGSAESQAIGKIEQGAQRQQPQKLVAPTTVEKVAGGQNQDVLFAKRFVEDKPVTAKYSSQEKQEFVGIEQQFT